MKKILLPLDFTPASKNAFNYALHLAKILKAELSILHVFLPISDNGTYPSEVIEFSRDTQMTKAEERLKKLTTHYPNKDAEDLLKFNVHIEYKVKEGLIIPSILETAKEINADLILLGSKSRAQISNIILGSAATEFITKTEQPVLLVPENYTFEKIENIAFATELKGNDSKAAIYLQELGQHLNAEIQPFFINQLPRDFFRDKEDQWLSDNLPLSGKAGTPVTVIREQGVVKGIDYYLEKHPAQILAMFTPKRKFLEKLFHVSATQRMVSKSNIPLLIYREK